MNTKEQKEMEAEIREAEKKIELHKSEETLKERKNRRIKGKVIGIVTTIVCPFAGIGYWIKMLDIESERGDKLNDLVIECMESMLSLAKGHMKDDDPKTPEC